MNNLPIKRGINFGDALEAPYEGAWSGYIIKQVLIM
jgi:endoglucanase